MPLQVGDTAKTTTLTERLFTEHDGQLRIMGKEGDSKLIWNPDNADEVAAARKMFTELRSKGHRAYRVKKDGEPGEEITAFDAAASKIILAPAMRGG